MCRRCVCRRLGDGGEDPAGRQTSGSLGGVCCWLYNQAVGRPRIFQPASRHKFSATAGAGLVPSRAAHVPVRMFGAAGKTVPIRTLIAHAPHPTRQLGGAVRKQHFPESITKCTSHLCKLRKSILRRGFLFCPQEAEFASSRVPVWPPSALRWIPQPLRQRGFHGITVV